MAYLPPPTRGQPKLYADLARTCGEILFLKAGHRFVAQEFLLRVVALLARG